MPFRPDDSSGAMRRGIQSLSALAFLLVAPALLPAAGSSCPPPPFPRWRRTCG